MLFLFVCFSSLQHTSYFCSQSAFLQHKLTFAAPQLWLRVNSNPPEVHKTISPHQSALRDKWQQKRLLFPHMELNHLDAVLCFVLCSLCKDRLLPSRFASGSYLKACLAVSRIILQHFRKDRGARQIRPLQIPEDSRICKLMQIVVNLGAASVGKTRRDTNVGSSSRQANHF